MKKNQIFGCISLLCLTSLALAMQPMDDQSLSATTGQDGISIGVGINTVQFNQISVIDKDGYSTDYAQKAGWVIASANANPVAINFIGASSSSPTFNLVADSDAGTNHASFTNLAISFSNQISGLTLSPFSIYLAGTGSTSSWNSSKSIFTGTDLNSDVKELLRVDSNIDVNFVSGNSPMMNLQLGNAPQGHLIQFGGAISSICSNGCPITVVSDNTGASFSLALKATDTTNGFSLNNFYAGIESSGFVFGNTGTSSKVDATLNNVTLGTIGQNSTDVFNGVHNGSMGNIGAVGASVTDLKIKISGM